MIAISPDLDLGHGLTAADYETEINDFQKFLENYNEKLAEIDGLRTELISREKKLNERNQRVLLATGSIYGKDSIEYEKVGGVRTSNIKHHKKTKVA
jgi:hypothetical protein